MVNKLSQRKLNFTLTLSIILILVFIIIQFQSIVSLKKSIESLNVKIDKIAACDSLTIEQASKWRFEQQSYIDQQEFNTSLVLTCFAVVIGLFGVFSFYNVGQSLKDNVTEVDEKIKNAITKQRLNNIEHSKKYNNISNDLIQFKIRFINGIIANKQTEINTMFDERKYSMGLFNLFGLVSLYAEIVELDPDSKWTKMGLKILQYQLYKAIFILREDEIIEVHAEPDIFAKAISNSKFFNNEKILAHLNTLLMKIRFSDQISLKNAKFREVPPPETNTNEE